jgi:alanyl-tRNA synthetase
LKANEWITTLMNAVGGGKGGGQVSFAKGTISIHGKTEKEIKELITSIINYESYQI